MTTDSSPDQDRPGDGAHQGPGRWAQRGAAGMGMLPGDSAADATVSGPPTPDAGAPDISPSLAGGHAGSSGAGQD
jgi:hypothetical protein